MEIFDKSIQNILISGQCNDNYYIDRVEVSIDNSRWKKADGTLDWELPWDISMYDVGEHKISVRAIDKSNLYSEKKVHFIINKSGYTEGPDIISYYHTPESPSNLSNIKIYADVNSSSFFQIQKVVANWDDGSSINSKNMWEYGNYPVQERHEEDPLKHLSNEPIYGIELGQFPKGTSISYWIEVFDSANNSKKSDKQYIFIE